MGINNEHILGEQTQYFVSTEQTSGTYEKPTTTEIAKANGYTKCMAMNTATFTPGGPKRKNRRDAYQSSRDTIERITGKTERSWAIDAYYVPSGTDTTMPDCGLFIEAMLGADATVNANDVTFAQSSAQALKTLSLQGYNANGWYMETMWGCLVEAMTFKATGGDEPRIHFDGRGMGFAQSGYATANGADTSTSLVLQTGEGNMFDVGSVIKIGSDDNTGAGYEVTAISSDTLTIEASATWIDDAIVLPFVPTWTDAGSPTTGITGSLTWDSLDLSTAITAFELTIKANNRYHDGIAFQQHLADASPGFIDIMGKIDLMIRKDMLLKILDRKDFETKALTVVVGGAAQSGTRAEIAMPYCELDFSDVTVPEEGEASISLPFVALGSSGNDAITWKHT